MHGNGCSTNGFAPKKRRLFLVLLLLLLPLVLSCITTTMTIEVTHAWKPGDVQNVIVSTSQEVSAEWTAEAKKANAEIVAQCQKENVPLTPEMHIPETYTEMMAQFGDEMSLGNDDEGTVTTQLPNGILMTKSFTLAEYQEENKDSTSGFAINMEKDPGSEATRYSADFTIPGMTKEGDPDQIDWAEWDAFVKSPDGPKPSCKPPVTTTAEANVTAQPGATKTTGFSSLLMPGGANTDSSSSSTPLLDYYTGRIYKKLGYPTWFRIVLDLPGEVTAHTINGETAGEIDDEGRVVFALDEAFFRKHTFKGPWVYHVASEVTAKMQKAGTDKKPAGLLAPAATKVKPTTAAATTKKTGSTPQAGASEQASSEPASSSPDARASASTTGLARFRIRQVSSYALGLSYGLSYANYELQELAADGTPGRYARLRFFGTGASLSLRFMPKWLRKNYDVKSVSDWTEFEVPAGAPFARLEDFDGIKGYHADSGMFMNSWSGAGFGTQESAEEPKLWVDLRGKQLGLYLGMDTAKGTWKVKL